MSDSATPSPDGAGFEVFWQEYGRKEGSKGKMNKQWDALKLATRQTILNGLNTYKQTKMVNGPQFLPMPQTFLNGRLWEAETFGQAPAPAYQTPNEIPGNWDTARQGAYTAPMGQGIPHPSSYLKPDFIPTC